MYEIQLGILFPMKLLCVYANWRHLFPTYEYMCMFSPIIEIEIFLQLFLEAGRLIRIFCFIAFAFCNYSWLLFLTFDIN